MSGERGEFSKNCDEYNEAKRKQKELGNEQLVNDIFVEPSGKLKLWKKGESKPAGKRPKVNYFTNLNDVEKKLKEMEAEEETEK